MIFLAATTDKLQLVTSSAAAIDVNASYVDAVKTTGATSDLNRQNTAISSAATTDILAAPGASTARNLKQMTVRNKDASLACDVTVVFDMNGTDFELHKVALNAGDTLEYIEGVGFFTLTAAERLNQMVYCTANSVHATAASLAAITGLAVAVKSGRTYAFDAALFHISNATTTGAQFGVGGVAMTLMVAGAISVVTNSVTAAAMSSGVATAVDTVIVAQTTGAAANAPTQLTGWFQPSADGTFVLKATSEVTVSNGLTVLKGSWLHVRETDN